MGEVEDVGGRESVEIGRQWVLCGGGKAKWEDGRWGM